MLSVPHRSFLLVLLLSWGWKTVNAQTPNVFPSYGDSAKWHVLGCYWMDCITHVDSFDSAIEICGYEYSRVTFGPGNVVYFRSDSLRTHFRRSTSCLDKEYLIYDFSMEPGESVWVGFEIGGWSSVDTIEAVLLNIDTIEQFGFERRRFNMRLGVSIWEYVMNMSWIEGIGSETDPFYPFLCLNGGCETNYKVLCYESAGTQLYQHPYYDTCSVTIIGIEEIQTVPALTLSPNPFSHILRVTAENARIIDAEVYSVLGKLVASIRAEDDVLQIELPQHLSNGMYVLRIRTDRGLFSEKVFKVYN